MKILQRMLIWEENSGLSPDFWENCMILKKILIGKRPFIDLSFKR
jgi:hypothetical protein